MTLVLIVDDVPAMAEQYAYDLKRLRGYETLVAKSGRTALESLTRDSVDCVILDLEMPGMDGFEVLRSVERLGLRVPIIVYTGTGDYDRCAQAIRLGAYSFIDKAEPMERVAQEVENAIERRRLTAEVTLLRHGFGLESPLVGTSPALAKLKEAIVRVAPVPSPVLVVGESGTGKELVARELHRLGLHPKGPLVALNSVAPLRERLSDVPALIEYLVAATCERFGMKRKTVAPDAVEALMAYDWRRNNIRELRNVVERMLIANDGDELTKAAVPAEIRDSKHAAPRTMHDGRRTFEEQKQEAERQIIVQAL